MLRLTGTVVRVLLVLNILVATGLVAFAMSTFAFEPRILVEIAGKVPVGSERLVLSGLRTVLLLMVPVAAAAHVIFTRLLAILRTVELGDPFIADNGGRLRAIAWALLAVQICDLVFGLVGYRIDLALGERVSGWSPGLTGWLAVLLLFVLARVFRAGARMRDELEFTV